MSLAAQRAARHLGRFATRRVRPADSIQRVLKHPQFHLHLDVTWQAAQAGAELVGAQA